jgi:hypothetical protein
MLQAFRLFFFNLFLVFDEFRSMSSIGTLGLNGYQKIKIKIIILNFKMFQWV